jgi:hypothetical protein
MRVCNRMRIAKSAATEQAVGLRLVHVLAESVHLTGCMAYTCLILAAGCLCIA